MKTMTERQSFYQLGYVSKNGFAWDSNPCPTKALIRDVLWTEVVAVHKVVLRLRIFPFMLRIFPYIRPAFKNP